MKKYLTIILILLVLFGCAKNNSIDYEDRYYNMIETINERKSFLKKSDNFDITTEISEIENGYRYYVIIDNPRIAMYGIEMIAIEKDVDYSQTMAANIGILEDASYNMIPGQSNPDKGYVAGISISGTTQNEETTLYVLVHWYGKNQNVVQEFFELPVSIYGEVNG